MNLKLSIVFVILFLIPFVIDSGVYLKYELPKILVFRILVEILIASFLFRSSPYPLISFFKRYWIQILIILITLIILYINAGNQIAFLWGTYHKRFGLFTIFHLIAFSLIIANIYHTHTVSIQKYFKNFVPISVLLSFGICSYQYFFTDTLSKTGQRWIGTFGQPDFFGSYILALLPFQINTLKEKGFKSRYGKFNLLSMVLSLILIWFSGSRILLVITLFYLLYISYKLLNNFKTKFKYVPLFVIMLLSAIAIFYSRIIEVGLEDEFRLKLWTGALYLIKENVWLGIGFDNIGYYLPTALYEVGVHSSVYVDRTHNEVFDWVLYAGLPLFLFFTFWLIRITSSFFYRTTDLFSHSVKVSFVFIVIYSMVNNNGIWNYIWMSFLIGIMLCEVFKEEQLKSYKSNKFHKVIILTALILAMTFNLKEYFADRYFKAFLKTSNVSDLITAYKLNSKEEIYWYYLLRNDTYLNNNYLENQRKLNEDTYRELKGI